VQHFGNFFSKLQKLVPPQRLQKEAIIKVLKEVTGQDIPPEAIKITRGVVYVPKTISAAVRSQIFIKQAYILDEISKLLPGQKNLSRIL
jgi:hypothetical protein